MGVSVVRDMNMVSPPVTPPRVKVYDVKARSGKSQKPIKPDSSSTFEQFPPVRLPSVVESFMRESLKSSDFRSCKIMNETAPSLLEQHMAAIGMDESEDKPHGRRMRYKHSKDNEDVDTGTDNSDVGVIARECSNRSSPYSQESEDSMLHGKDLALL